MKEQKMAKKPLVEVMAQVYVTEYCEHDPLMPTWDQLNATVQNRVLASMTEVARTIGYFEKRGAVTVQLIDALPKDPPTDEKRIKAALDPMTTQGEVAGPEGGEYCNVCQMFAVKRVSSCKTVCGACGAIDGGCG